MPRKMDIEWLPGDSYLIVNKDYGYRYIRVTFLDCADEILFSDDMNNIVKKFRDVLQEFFESIKIEE